MHKTYNEKENTFNTNQLEAATKRGKRILWANAYCLLDTSSGASISVRQILLQLINEGYEIEIVGATNFDAPSGVERLKNFWEKLKTVTAPVINIEDGPLLHRLVKTKSTHRFEMTEVEATDLIQLYLTRLDRFKPDLVFFYGGQPTDFHIAAEARARGIPSASYLVNANYVGARWCRDVDVIVTDTEATANFYKEKCGFKPLPVGKFIDRSKIIAKEHTRKNLTFVNPSLAKGAGLVAQIAVLLERRRPDIKIEIVESRGDWSTVVKDVMRDFFKQDFHTLTNVIITPNTASMDKVYSRSRVLLAPSFWWESGSRVIAEAMINGIPTITTNNGGGPEMVGDGGIILQLPPACHISPYNQLPTLEILEQIINMIEKLWDDEILYLGFMTKALSHGSKFHSIENSTQRLTKVFKNLIQTNRRAQRDELLKKLHKHSLVDEQVEFGLENKEINGFKWDYFPSKENSILVSKFVFFWVGELVPMLEQFVESIRWQYGKSAKITQISDFETKKVIGVDEIKRVDCPKEMMFARMQAYSVFDDGNEYIAFYDTDTLFINTIRVPVKPNIDHFFVTRTDDFLMNHNQGHLEYYPEFKEKNVKTVMPYIGGCIITRRPKQLFTELLEIYRNLPARMHRWYGDQVALHKFGQKNPINLSEISEENFLKSFGENVSDDLLDKLYTDKVFNLHFKGVHEKKYFPEWFKFLAKRQR